MNPRVVSGKRAARRSNGETGFTILELLVAVAITLVVAGMMLAVVTLTLSLWHRTQDNFATTAQAQLALDMVERDLQAAVFRDDGGTWLAVEVINNPPSLDNHGWLTSSASKPAGTESQRLVPAATNGAVPLIGEARFGLSGAWLRLMTTNVESGGSLPVAVSYQIARRPLSGAISNTNLADVRYSLFRAAVSAENSLAGGNDVTASAYASTSSAPTAARSSATLTNPNTTDALATNVADVGVWLYVRETSGGLRRIFPADTNDTMHGANGSVTGPDGARFPDVADVMVRILTEQGATMLAEVESGSGRVLRPEAYATDAEWWWAVVEANSRVYVRRVELKRGLP